MVARLRFGDPITKIELRLSELGIPPHCIEKHVQALRALAAKARKTNAPAGGVQAAPL